ncbi:hypothetical protein Q361_10656 [Flavobacterium croceum DSM 17960]|uniref:S-adenosyl-l-methionine hydroxide adenosyltransferase n=1 Tax=Flavobacterium croceum DSM 17960 TaxID=1121886 RepID=A0A2S4N8H8_9FLAO|nr:SAM-dependent chlorinase/fluorinase [Flavobacterium croceum]POS01994.1 hypothetical protein Q361_10656 [Flavobacterium croceum DSM 17960]
MSIITLTTDYGHKDYFVGAIKGKLIAAEKNITVVDISHDIDPFNIAEASYILGRAYQGFPVGTIHIIGVDVEKNHENQHVAIKWNDHYFIGADNGILSMMLQGSTPQEMVTLNLGESVKDLSDIDIILYSALHLVHTKSLESIGTTTTSLKSISQLQASISTDAKIISGNIIYIDHFGNAVSNITRELFYKNVNGRTFEIKFKRNKISTIYTKYSDIAVGTNYPIKNYEGLQMALFNEAGFLEIAIFKSNPNVGSAKSLLGLNYHDVITIEFN